jgi:hypothetical protein
MSIEGQGEAIEMAKMMRLDDISVSVPSNTSEDKNLQVESNMVNKQGK